MTILNIRFVFYKAKALPRANKPSALSSTLVFRSLFTFHSSKLAAEHEASLGFNPKGCCCNPVIPSSVCSNTLYSTPRTAYQSKPPHVWQAQGGHSYPPTNVIVWHRQLWNLKPSAYHLGLNGLKLSKHQEQALTVSTLWYWPVWNQHWSLMPILIERSFLFSLFWSPPSPCSTVFVHFLL